MFKNLVRRSQFIAVTINNETVSQYVEADEVNVKVLSASTAPVHMQRQRERDLAAFVDKNWDFTDESTHDQATLDPAFGWVRLDSPIDSDGKFKNVATATDRAFGLGYKENVAFSSTGQGRVLIELVNYVTSQIGA